MARAIYLPYYIVLSDAARVAELQATYPNGINQAIANPVPPSTPTAGAVVAFNAPFVGYNEAAAAAVIGDHIWTPYYGSAQTSGKPFPIDVATFVVHTGGFWGIGGTSVRHYWIGNFVYSGTAAAPPNVEPPEAAGDPPVPALVYAPIAQRRFIDGFEMRQAETRATSSHRPSYSGARRTGGKGFRCFAAGSDSKLVATTLFGATASPASVWTRFRARWSRAGYASQVFMQWRSSTNCLITLTITPTGDVVLAIYDSNTTTSATIGTVFSMTAQTWYGCDAIIEWNTSLILGAGHGRVRIYVNKTIAFDQIFPDESIAPTCAGPGRRNNYHQDFTYGNVNSTASVLTLLDLDDLIEADLPAGRSDASAWDATVAYVLGNTVLGSDHRVYKCKATCTGLNPTSDPLRATYWDFYEGYDWLNGSAIVRCKVKSLTVNNAWAGDYRGLNQPASAMTNRAVMTSSVSGAILEADLDIDRTALNLKGSLGMVSAVFGVHAFSAANENATLSYDIGGGNTGATTVALPNTAASSLQTMYRPSGLMAPTTSSTLKARLLHAASVNLNSCISMWAMVEVVGVFGADDLRVAAYPDGVPAIPDGNALYQHNAPYWNTPWAWNPPGAPPGSAAVVIVGGTYVGTGTGLDLTFRVPVHFYLVRPTTGTRSGGAKWFSTAHYGHQDDNQGIEAMHAVDACEDPSFVAASGDDAQQNRYMIRIAGGNQQSNALGVTYQYIAVSDPGGRYLMNHAEQGNASSIGQDTTLALPNADFVPEWLWGIFEEESNVTGAAMLYKSLGHAAATVGRLGQTAVTTAITFGTGSLRVQQALYSIQSGNTCDNIAYSLWRRHDGNDDPNEAKLWTFGSYTGDGTASRSVTCGTAGLRPLFAAVLGDNGNGCMRDPSHTTTDSETASGGGSAATGITAGALDGFSVGATLNTNAVLFHYFVIWGSATAGNNGWSINGEFVPIEAAPPVDGPFAPEPTDISDFEPVGPEGPEEPGGGGGDILITDPDFDTETDILTDGTDIGGVTGGAPCETYVRELVNIALSHLEISKVVGNLATELSEAASLARRHVRADINAVLRAHPWDFATRYADLVLVAGTATVKVNNDWQYSYRVPSGCITARRIAKVTSGRKFDPEPMPFRLGQDASGLLLYCNEAATTEVPLVLEYTFRNECPAFWGDPLFREALTWKFASSLSPLARDPKKKEFCLQMFHMVVARGQTVDVNEQQQEHPGDATWIIERQ